MTFKATFDRVGKRVNLGIDLTGFSGRDQIHLFIELARELGISERLKEDPETLKIFEEQLPHWWKEEEGKWK